MKQTIFKGSGVAIITPMLEDGSVNYPVLKELLEQQIAGEEKRTEEIEEYRKYTTTKKYAEEVANDKLGLVHDGEIIFKEKK